MNDELTFYVEPERGPDPPGVRAGYVVIWSGKPGPAAVATCAQLVDTDGTSSFELTGEFEPCTVVDDTDG